MAALNVYGHISNENNLIRKKMNEISKNKSWITAILSYSCTVLLGSFVVIIHSTLVPLADAYRVDLVRAALLISALGVGRILTQMIGGWLTDHLGRKQMFLAGQVLLLVFFISLPFSSSFELSLALCVIAGMGYGFLNTSSLAVIFDCFAPQGKNAIAQSFVQLMFATGGILTPLLANRLLDSGPRFTRAVLYQLS